MRAAAETFPLLEAMAREGNPASASDAGVGALAAVAAVRGAALNVRINAASLADKETARTLADEAAAICDGAVAKSEHILEIVNSHIDI